MNNANPPPQQALSQAGYQGLGTDANGNPTFTPYQAGPNPNAAQENASFNGYQAQNANAAQINQGPTGQTINQEQGLAAQLGQEAQGMGPSAAQAQLASATSGNVANAAALSAAAGAGGSAGAARFNAANQAGQLNQQAGNQAAQLEAQQALGAQGQQAGVLGTIAGQQQSFAQTQAALNQQAALANQGAANQAGQFNASSQQNLAALQQQNYEFGQGLSAQSQSQYNQSIAALQLAQEGQNAAAQQNLYAGLGGFATGSIGALGNAKFADGGVVDEPTHATVGEAGPEAVVPLAPSTPSAPAGTTDYTARIAALHKMTQETLAQIQSNGRPQASDKDTGVPSLYKSGQQGAQNVGKLIQKMMSQKAPETGAKSLNPQSIDQSATGGLSSDTAGAESAAASSGGGAEATGAAAAGETGAAGATDASGLSALPTAGGAAEAGDAGAAAAGGTDAAAAGGAAAEGASTAAELAPLALAAAKGKVVKGPTHLLVGEAGPEAVIPVKPDGSADMNRAKDPKLRGLLASRPDLKHPVSAAAVKGPTGSPLDRIHKMQAQLSDLERVLSATTKARRKAG